MAEVVEKRKHFKIKFPGVNLGTGLMFLAAATIALVVLFGVSISPLWIFAPFVLPFAALAALVVLAIAAGLVLLVLTISAVLIAFVPLCILALFICEAGEEETKENVKLEED